VNRICNLDRAEGFMRKIGGPRLICKLNSKTRDLGVKSVKDLDCGLILEKNRVLCAKVTGISIITKLFF
jgi:hypothetical protein